MKKSKPVILGVSCLITGILFLGFALAENAQTTNSPHFSANEIMDKAFWAVRLDGVEMLSTLTIYNAKGNERVRKTAGVSKLYDGGQTEKRLVRFTAPADVKGTGLLTYDYEKKDDDIWFFLPALRKTRRIVASEKAKSFMGSEFTYADMTPPPVEEFNHRLLPKEVVQNVSCWVIESVPNNEKIAEENGFARKISYVGKDDFIVRKAIYYDLDQELHKELRVLDVQEIDTQKHRYRPMHLVMENKQNNRRSVLKIEKIQLRPDIPDEYFTTRYLERE
ncbi:outer membrane lipoprotein-sorting protein [candidate division CSSED10-310 bacterium]|uniref:Outer membrane lipoprotein-sorting protein n=1 Tax=candidate division CSSED10-310 bacterium TaxID=2855610 RepID=A0ABV6YZA5_UNCC1